MKCYTQVYVKNSYEAAVVIEPIHELPWNKYCATIIDKFGVCWWIAIY